MWILFLYIIASGGRDISINELLVGSEADCWATEKKHHKAEPHKVGDWSMSVRGDEITLSRCAKGGK